METAVELRMNYVESMQRFIFKQKPMKSFYYGYIICLRKVMQQSKKYATGTALLTKFDIITIYSETLLDLIKN